MSDSTATSIFKWDTLREVGPRVLRFRDPIEGVMLEVELTSGHKILVFRSLDREFYFCHGLTFGGKDAAGGAVSPFSGKDVSTIIDNHYSPVAATIAQEGDILVWKGPNGETPHSAILVMPIIAPGMDDLDYRSLLRSKNGKLPEETMTLEKLAADPDGYGETYIIFRRT